MDAARIMIVEDNTTVAQDCRDCLEGLGYVVTSCVPSGEEAVEKAETERPDAVIMDIQLRDQMDGISAAKEIHSRFAIPVVFLSAYGDSDLLDRAKRVGSFGYLVKPFEERELCATLEMALYKAKSEREHARMEVRLRQTQKMEGLQVMAGSIAHNFNNMLHAALGFTELALSGLPADSEAGKAIDEAARSIKRAVDISTLMRLYVGQGQGEIENTNLSVIVQAASAVLHSATPGRISLSIDLAHEDAMIHANPAQLHQLLTNLFTNAVEAIGVKAGDIAIATRVEALGRDELNETYLHEDLPAGDYAILEVADTGSGMNEEALTRAFDPFFSTKFTGRGLGLAAVLGIVRGHNGAIDIRNQAEQGATFRVFFPVVGRLEMPTTVAPAETIEGFSGGATILLVDDENSVRRIGTIMLQRLGHTVRLAANGREALDVFSECPEDFDLVVLDLTMPLMGGEEVFAELRRIRPDLRIVLSSGYDEQEINRRFAGKGLTGFLPKPYNQEQLREKLNAALSL